MANPKEWRPVIHRQAPNAIGIVKEVVPGVRQGPCCEVCYVRIPVIAYSRNSPFPSVYIVVCVLSDRTLNRVF